MIKNIIIAGLIATTLVFGFLYLTSSSPLGASTSEYNVKQFLNTVTFSGATTLSGTNTLSGATTLSGGVTLSGSTSTLSGVNFVSNSTSTGIVLRASDGNCYLISLGTGGAYATSTASCQ